MQIKIIIVKSEALATILLNSKNNKKHLYATLYVFFCLKMYENDR